MPASSTERFHLDRVATPIGVALLVTDAEGRLCALDWVDYEHRMAELMRQQHGRADLVEGAAPRPVTRALNDYFAGDLGALAAVPCRFGGTPFQRAVWSALRGIAPGATTSYGRLAARIERPRAVRAVGHANGANPISVVVPCHRVIGASGALTGYGGGLDRKRWLLRHEGVAVG
ncbi:MAG: methylated-DNA--[protein]-cysteine S-methyltransferase [Xanthobacteraceae bacterium]|nr:methylated-DNA--[protein]-cysteine S-methyltransferase [Xanthobacteraceae bacterium]